MKSGNAYRIERQQEISIVLYNIKRIYTYMSFFPLWTPNISRTFFFFLLHSLVRFISLFIVSFQSTDRTNHFGFLFLRKKKERRKRLHVSIKTETKRNSCNIIFVYWMYTTAALGLKMKAMKHLCERLSYKIRSPEWVFDQQKFGQEQSRGSFYIEY